MDKSSLGDRIKRYEGLSSIKLIPLLPIVIRLDGKNFSSYTKEFERPFDRKLANNFDRTTKSLMDECGACLGYTQSDEISLVILHEDYKSQTYFNGKIQKICSVLSSLCTHNFLLGAIANKFNACRPCLFDCRVFNVPNVIEAYNCILWREQDATRNSIQMLARHHFSHNECDNQNQHQLQDMLMSKGINWNNEQERFKRGGMFRRAVRFDTLSKDEIKKLPPKHNALKNQDTPIKRNYIEQVKYPDGIVKLSQLDNPVEFLFKND